MTEETKKPKGEQASPKLGNSAEKSCGELNTTLETVSLPAEKAYHLHKIEVLGELKEEMLTWAKGRFWAVSIIVLLVGFLGGASLITGLIESRVSTKIENEIGRYQSKLDELREVTAISKSTIAEANKLAVSVKGELTEFSKESVELESRAISIANDLSKLSVSGFEVSEELRVELKNLSIVVKSLAERQSEIDSRSNTLVEKIQNIQGQLTYAEEKIVREKGKAKLSKYPIKIRNFPEYEKVKDNLEDKGFSVKVEKTTDSIKKWPGIGISEHLPVELAQQIIKTVRSTWPEMNYVYLRDIREGNVTLIGGWLGWLEDFGYHALSEEDFTRLEKQDITKEEFIAIIKSFKKAN